MKIKVCTNIKERFFGLMFIKQKLNYGLCFPKCNSIHTFFMKQSIDVIMTNKNHQILYIYSNLKPRKIILPKKEVYYTYELPCNFSNNLKINDYFNYNSYSNS